MNNHNISLPEFEEIFLPEIGKELLPFRPHAQSG